MFAFFILSVRGLFAPFRSVKSFQRECEDIDLKGCERWSAHCWCAYLRNPVFLLFFIESSLLGGEKGGRASVWWSKVIFEHLQRKILLFDGKHSERPQKSCLAPGSDELFIFTTRTDTILHDAISLLCLSPFSAARFKDCFNIMIYRLKRLVNRLSISNRAASLRFHCSTCARSSVCASLKL